MFLLFYFTPESQIHGFIKIGIYISCKITTPERMANLESFTKVINFQTVGTF